MRLPQRKSQQLKDEDTSDDVVYLTPEGVEKLKRELIRIETVDLPPTLESMRFALSLGDFSENAEYQEAKPKLARLQARILTIKDRLKRAIIVDGSDSGRVEIGSTVTVLVNGEKERLYQIVGSREANPTQGRISYLSPVGAALLNRKLNETVDVVNDERTVTYLILKIE